MQRLYFVIILILIFLKQIAYEIYNFNRDLKYELYHDVVILVLID